MLWKTCIHLMFLTCIVHQQSSLRCNSSFLHMSFTSSPLYCRSFVHAEHDLQSCCYVYGQEQTNAYQYLRTRVLPGVLFHQQACPVSNSTVRDATAAAAVTARRRGSHLEPAKIRVPDHCRSIERSITQRLADLGSRANITIHNLQLSSGRRYVANLPSCIVLSYALLGTRLASYSPGLHLVECCRMLITSNCQHRTRQ